MRETETETDRQTDRQDGGGRDMEVEGWGVLGVGEKSYLKRKLKRTKNKQNNEETGRGGGPLRK